MTLNDYLIQEAKEKCVCHRQVVNYLLSVRCFAAAESYLSGLKPEELDNRLDA
jgi:hypothetical protein